MLQAVLFWVLVLEYWGSFAIIPENMGIENFKGIYPADKEELSRILSRQRQRKETLYAGKPDVALLALNLAKEGGYGLREASNKLDPSKIASGLTPHDVLAMPEGIREELSDSLAAITFGIGVYSIDDTIWNKTFSYELVASLYNENAVGTPFPRLMVGSVKEEPIFDDKYREMISLATEDKTLTSFFKARNTHTMPNGLAGFIGQMEVLPVIRGKIIPIFRSRAQLVISS